MSDGAFLGLVLVALCLPPMLAPPAIMARRRIGIPLALVGAIGGAIVYFSATPPVRHDGVISLGAFDDVGYFLQRGYGGMLLAVHGLIALVRTGLALREAYRPWPDETTKEEVTSGADLPRARAESGAGEDPPA